MTERAPDLADGPNHVRFTLAPEDLIDAYRRHAYGRLWSRASLVSAGVSLLIVAGMVHVFMSDAPWTGVAAVFVAAMLGGILVPLAMIRWRVPFFARRIYRQQRSLQREVTLDWDASALGGTTDTGQSRVAWGDLVQWREDDNIILLYHSDALFQMIPKRVLSPRQIDDLKALAAAAKVKGAEPAGCR